MDPLIVANVVMFSFAFYASLRKFLNEKRTRLFRLPAVFISGYILSVYALNMIGLVEVMDIRIYMRWFQLVIAAYIMLEARHG